MILSIDFDIIMYPSLDDSIEYKISHEHWDWKEQNLKVDFKIYSILTQMLLQLKEKTQFHFITTHQQIVNLINEKTDIINIDHHHDLYYDEQSRIKTTIKNLNCGNWGKYLYDSNLLNSFTWVKDIKSCGLKTLPIESDLKFNEININNFKLKEIPEKVIICLSPEWIHPDLFPLFTLWKKVLKNE